MSWIILESKILKAIAARKRRGYPQLRARIVGFQYFDFRR